MISSKRWEDEWKALKERGIDGFKVGVPTGQYPGPIYWDKYCDNCGVIMDKRVEENDKKHYCSECKHLFARLHTSMLILSIFNKYKLL